MYKTIQLEPNKKDEYRIWCLTDAHTGLVKGNKHGNLSPLYLGALARAANETLGGNNGVSMVVDLGDFSDRKDEDWELNTEKYAEAMGGLGSEIAFAALQGNHDTNYEGRIEILKQSMKRPDLTAETQVMDVGPARLLLYKTDILGVNDGGDMIIPEQDVQSYRKFESCAAADGKISMTMSHPGFGSASEDFKQQKIQHHRDVEGYRFLDGKYYFKNAEKIRAIQEEFGVHALDLSGHRHKADFSKRFLTVPAFCWSNPNIQGHPSATFLDMRVRPDGISAQFASVNISGDVIPAQTHIPNDVVNAIANISFDELIAA
jgi:hypothetical protein